MELKEAYETATLRFHEACSTLARTAPISWWRAWNADPTEHARNAGRVAIAEMELASLAFRYAVERVSGGSGQAMIEAAADATMAKTHHERLMGEDEYAKLLRWKDLYRDDVLKKVRWSPYQP